MGLTRYAFLVRGPGFVPERDRTELRTPAFEVQVVGVESVEQAVEEARTLAAGGVQVIEMCGGFDRRAAARVDAAVEPAAAVGVVTFRGAARRRLHRLLSDDSGAAA